MNPEEIKPVEVFLGTAWQADQIKGMLLDNEIEAFLGDEIWGSDAPMEHAPGVAGGVRVFVARDEVEDARTVVSRYYEGGLEDDFQ